jgi:hypothetical protein
VYITDPPPDLWDGSTAGGFAGGGGSIADPYRIRTSAQLAYLAQQVNDAGNTYAGKYFILTRNLDLDGHDWMAIGTNTKRFSGSFDGQENVISGIFIDKSDTDYQGLFGYLYGATVSNLGLEDVSITGQNYVGGIAGGTYSSSIENCYSTGDISGTNQVGGIAGDTYSNIDNCYSTGDISGTNQVGGIVGETYSSSIESCYSTGDISGTEYQVGGIVGYLYYNSSIDNCYSTGTVSGYQQVGGIAGQVYSFDNSSNIENCYSTGMVSGTSQVGGIAGRVYSYGSGGSNIKRCAALNPAVTASTSNAGRVAGYISGGGTFTDNAAWDEMVPGNVPFNADANNHGADISTNDVKDGTGFPFNVNEDPWTHTPGKLPTLKDLEGQEGTLPEHLK